MTDTEIDEMVRHARAAVANGDPSDASRAIVELSERLQRYQLAELRARANCQPSNG